MQTARSTCDGQSVPFMYELDVSSHKMQRFCFQTDPLYIFVFKSLGTNYIYIYIYIMRVILIEYCDTLEVIILKGRDDEGRY